jgi:hypothetical protein
MARFESATSFIAPVDPEVATKTCASIGGSIRSNLSRSAAGMRGLRRRWDAADSKSIMIVERKIRRRAAGGTAAGPAALRFARARRFARALRSMVVIAALSHRAMFERREWLEPAPWQTL